MQSHLRTFVINVEVPGVIVLLVGELQPMRMTNLLGLKGGVQVFDGNYSFGAFGLLNNKYVIVHFRAGRKDTAIRFNSWAAVCAF